MTHKLQHPFTLIVAGPSACDKSTPVIKLIECREQLCDTVYKNIVWCDSENNAPHHLKDVSFVKGAPDFDNPEHVPTLITLDDLMDSAYSTKVSELFTKGSHHRNINLVLISQNLFHHVPSARDISLSSKYIVVFKNPTDKTQIVHLARQVYPENISSFHKIYLDVCRDPHTYLFLDLTQSVNDLLRFRTKIFSDDVTEVFAPVKSNEPIEITTTLSPRS
jgi:hypothetical protein